MKFYNVEICESPVNVDGYRSIICVIYNTGELDNYRHININMQTLKNGTILISNIDSGGDFNLFLKLKDKIISIKGICKDITKYSSLEDDIKIFRDLYRACNYDAKVFIGLLKL